jgi:hypothetical protein
MRFRPSVILGFGIGYLVGARAGRERYDLIMRQVRELRERPEVQGAAGVVSAQAGNLVEKVRAAVGRSGSSVPFPASTGTHPNGSGGFPDA